MPPRLRFDPDRGDPWRELRAFRKVGRNHRNGAEECPAVMSHERERNWRWLDILAQAASDIAERVAGILPPGEPDPLGDRVEKFRTLAQVRDRERRTSRFGSEEVEPGSRLSF